MYMDNIELYNKTAREWVKTYANMEALEAAKISKLTDMGFTEAQARVGFGDLRMLLKKSAGTKKQPSTF